MGFWQNLNKPIIGLAPMDGVTDAAMRRITARYGRPDVTYTEFVNVEYAINKPTVLLKRLIYSNEERPVVAQLSGSNPDLFYPLAIVVCYLGFDGLDLNLGCPAKSVVSRGAGAGLIGEKEIVSKIIDAIQRACRDWQNQPQLSRWLSNKDLIMAAKQLKTSCPTVSQRPILSCKTRIQDKQTADIRWGNFLTNLPFEAVVFHGRMAAQGNSGPVNWPRLKKIAEAVHSNDKVFIANGGVNDRREAEEHCRQFSCDGVLIGQAALGNPWVFTDKNPDKRQRLQVMLEQARLFVRLFGEENFVRLRKHFAWYPREFYRANRFKQRLLKTNNLKEVEDIVSQALKNEAD